MERMKVNVCLRSRLHYLDEDMRNQLAHLLCRRPVRLARTNASLFEGFWQQSGIVIVWHIAICYLPNR